MASLKGPFTFTGSIGNIRSYYDRKKKCYILATKGGSSKEMIENNPSFARTRENMNEFKACGIWASQLRKSLLPIEHLHTGYYFAEIVALAKRIQKHDDVNLRGFRSLLSSKDSNLLTMIEFNRAHSFDRVFSSFYEAKLSDDKQTVTLRIPDFKPFSRLSWPNKFSSYRISLVIAQLPDYIYNEEDKLYNPVQKNMESLTVSAFSPWRPNDTVVEDIVLQASFAEPALQIPGTTVLVAMGVEISSLTPASNGNDSSFFGTMKIVECFV